MRFDVTMTGETKVASFATEDEAREHIEFRLFGDEVSARSTTMVRVGASRTAWQDLFYHRNGVILARARAETGSVSEYREACQRGHLWRP